MKANHRKVVGVLVILGVWVVGLGCYPLITWSSLNCRHEEIDINTGRIRHQRYLLGLRISERTLDSPISRELKLEREADWQRVNTFSPGVRHSPHYIFHSAIHQSKEVGRLWQLASFTPDAKKRICGEVLRLWQDGKRDDAAKPYIEALWATALDRVSDDQNDPPPITAEELPMNKHRP